MSKHSYLFYFVLFFAIACKDEVVIDPREESLGSYSFTGETLSWNGTSMTWPGSDYHDKGTVTLSKDPKNEDGLVVKGGSFEIKINGTKKGEFGFWFNVPNQTIILATGKSTQIAGSYAASYYDSEASFHGIYDRVSNSFSFYFSDVSDPSLVYWYEGVKK